MQFHEHERERKLIIDRPVKLSDLKTLSPCQPALTILGNKTNLLSLCIGTHNNIMKALFPLGYVREVK